MVKSTTPGLVGVTGPTVGVGEGVTGSLNGFEGVGFVIGLVVGCGAGHLDILPIDTAVTMKAIINLSVLFF